MEMAEAMWVAQVADRADAGQMTETPIAAELLFAGIKITVIS